MKKKELLLFAVLLVVWLFVPLSSMATVYLDEDFYSPTFTTGIPIGWNSEGNAQYPWSRNSNGYQGACLRFSNSSNRVGQTNVLFTPKISLPNNSIACLEFMFMNICGGDLTICVTTDDGTTFDTLGTALVAERWIYLKYPLSKFSGHSFNVAFCSTSNWSSATNPHHYIDNVVIQDPPLCAKPINLSINGMKQASATIGWELDFALSDPDRYIV